MPIYSYIVYPQKGEKEKLAAQLNAMHQCEAFPSTNEDMLILATETADNIQESLLQEGLKLIPQIQAMALVYGQETPDEL